jgi:hypothetical protein
MKIHFPIGAAVLAVILLATASDGQSPMPSADLSQLTTVIQRDFRSIDDIHMIRMSDEPGGRFDFVVMGLRHRWSGWRVEAISIEHHQLRIRWDSESKISVKEIEFALSGPKAVDIQEKDNDYNLLISGCAPHLCFDGVHGFLLFSAKTAKTYKAKVVTQGLDKALTDTPKYDVTFSPGITSDAKDILQDAICSSSSNEISNKSGLPFECKNP